MTTRHALFLAAVLAATVLTGGAAILGLNHVPSSAAPAPAAVRAVQPAPAPAQWEGGD